MPAITITEFTDPACPWACSAEPARLLLGWCEAPPSSAEVAEVMGSSIADAREQLGSVATLEPVGTDGFWRAQPLAATAR